jgi:hypothetical protein
MKTLFSLALILCAVPAFAGESCLNKEEAKLLNDIRSREMAAHMRHPECARGWGAAACISPFDQAGKEWLERKENGDAKACAQPALQTPEDKNSQEE